MIAWVGRSLAVITALLVSLACTSTAARPATESAPAAASTQSAAPPSTAAGAAAQPAARVKVEMPYGGRGVAGLVHYLAAEEGY